MREFSCQLNLQQKQELVINPILDFFTILEKSKINVVYNPFLKKYCTVRRNLGTFPVYVPEVGHMLSLETVSEEVSKEFYDETRTYEGFQSKERVMTAKLYNHDPDLNRVVTWGNYSSFAVPDRLYKLYLSNLLNDFLFSPSVIRRRTLISPNRWFIIESQNNYHFKCTANYNIGLIHLTKESLREARKVNVWLNAPQEVYEVKAGFVKFSTFGDVLFTNGVFVHFPTDPTELEPRIGPNGEYFICFMMSLNEYTTNWPSFSTSFGRNVVNINLIENLSELVFSPYELFPFIFPNYIGATRGLDSLVYEFMVGKDTFDRIVGRLMRFSSNQNAFLLDDYTAFVEDYNKLLRIELEEGIYSVRWLNPSVLPFLIKRYPEGRRDINAMLDNQDLLKALSEVNAEFANSKTGCPRYMFLAGLGRYSSPRRTWLLKYYDAWTKS
ncbi:MAG: hypothetical protein HPY73_03240 [Methanomassiliicoccales archaeon]|nr:MAG: hypothetical protein HPY73_03240 [Methanomassiliicoccales archaeon]